MAGTSKDYSNNATFSILHGMLDTEQLVEFVEIARSANHSYQCPECGHPDAQDKDEHWVMRHNEGCVIGAVEDYCISQGFID